MSGAAEPQWAAAAAPARPRPPSPAPPPPDSRLPEVTWGPRQVVVLRRWSPVLASDTSDAHSGAAALRPPHAAPTAPTGPAAPPAPSQSRGAAAAAHSAAGPRGTRTPPPPACPPARLPVCPPACRRLRWPPVPVRRSLIFKMRGPELLLLLALALPGLRAAPAAPAGEGAGAGAGPSAAVAGEPPPTSPGALEPPSAYVERLLLGGGARERSRRAASPAVDSVEDGPARWRPQNAPKPQFVTKRGHEASAAAAAAGAYGARAAPDDAAAARFNEIPLPERGPAPAAYARYEPPGPPAAYRSADPYARPAAPRRVVYYADLPDVVRPRSYATADARAYAGRDYDPYGRGPPKYPRDGRYDERSPFSAYGRDDWYRYRNAPPPPPAPNSYAIIDAERAPGPAQPARGPYAPGRPYPDPDPASRYNRVPAPYLQRNAGALPPLAPSPASPYDQYRRPPPGGAARLSVGPSRLAEPYRDYNPRQPAPWSMQIGTSLTVKDEDRNPYGAGRRFYVQSQDQGRFAAPPPARYSRVEDDPRHRL
ncbi:hypothetical protein R5R35_005006 [Gryllus longicercus]|uniref:Uncharacterized protein n=1 Tax=Gryllus longicercus TaxID=2509291 RepID=A0AAN9Z7R8_9ORTH